MKKIIEVCFIIAICTVFSGCVPHTDYEDNEIEFYQIGTGWFAVNLRYIEFNGHRYIIRSDGHQGGICHDPDCPYCKDN